MVKVRTSVAIVRGEEPLVMVGKALDLIDAKSLIKPEDRILIKPNYVVAEPPSTGITTDSVVLEKIITFAKKCGVKNIVVGEGGADDTERAFDIVGIRKITTKQKVKLVNLNRDTRITVKVPQALALKEVGVAETALKSTCIINVPKLKVHHMALVTLSMKNLMGLILPKSIMHNQINEKIVDLTSFFRSKVRINIIDGIIGAELDETRGSPVKTGVIIAGEDIVAVDTVATAVMGIEPKKVKYLKLAEKKGLGISNLKKIETLGEKIENVMIKFKV